MTTTITPETEARPAGWCYQCGRETGTERHNVHSADHFLPQPIPFRWVMYGALADAAEHAGMTVEDFMTATLRELR